MNFGLDHYLHYSLYALFHWFIYLLSYIITKNNKTSFFTGFIFCTYPILVHYSQEARPETLLVFLCTIVMVCIAIKIEYNYNYILGESLYSIIKNKNCNKKLIFSDILLLIFIISNVLILIVHHAAILFIPVSGILLLSNLFFNNNKFKYIINLISIYSIIFLTYSIFFLKYFLHSLNYFNNNFINPILSPLQYTDKISSLYGSNELPIIIFIMFIPIAFFGLYKLYSTKKYYWLTYLSTCWILVIILQLTIIITYAYVFRYHNLIWTIVPYIILITYGISNIKNKYICTLLIISIICFAIIGNISSQYKTNTPWIEITQNIETNITHNEAVLLCPSFMAIPFKYHLDKLQSNNIEIYSYYYNSKRVIKMNYTQQYWENKEIYNDLSHDDLNNYKTVYIINSNCDINIIKSNLFNNKILELKYSYDIKDGFIRHTLLNILRKQNIIDKKPTIDIFTVK